MKKNYLFNPFTYIAGWKALAIGWAIMLLTACMAYIGRTHFDGIIDVHAGLPAPFWAFVLDAFIAWALTVLFFLWSGVDLFRIGREAGRYRRHDGPCAGADGARSLSLPGDAATKRY